MEAIPKSDKKNLLSDLTVSQNPRSHMKTSLVNFRYFDISRYSFMTHLPGPNLKVPKFSKNYGNTWKLVFPFKGIWEYLNILDFLGATQTESLTVFRDLFHDPSSGAQPKCTTAV